MDRGRLRRDGPEAFSLEAFGRALGSRDPAELWNGLRAALSFSRTPGFRSFLQSYQQTSPDFKELVEPYQRSKEEQFIPNIGLLLLYMEVLKSLFHSSLFNAEKMFIDSLFDRDIIKDVIRSLAHVRGVVRKKTPFKDISSWDVKLRFIRSILKYSLKIKRSSSSSDDSSLYSRVVHEIVGLLMGINLKYFFDLLELDSYEAAKGNKTAFQELCPMYNEVKKPCKYNWKTSRNILLRQPLVDIIVLIAHSPFHISSLINACTIDYITSHCTTINIASNVKGANAIQMAAKAELTTTDPELLKKQLGERSNYNFFVKEFARAGNLGPIFIEVEKSFKSKGTSNVEKDLFENTFLAYHYQESIEFLNSQYILARFYDIKGFLPISTEVNNVLAFLHFLCINFRIKLLLHDVKEKFNNDALTSVTFDFNEWKITNHHRDFLSASPLLCYDTLKTLFFISALDWSKFLDTPASEKDPILVVWEEIKNYGSDNKCESSENRVYEIAYAPHLGNPKEELNRSLKFIYGAVSAIFDVIIELKQELFSKIMDANLGEKNENEHGDTNIFISFFNPVAFEKHSKLLKTIISKCFTSMLHKYLSSKVVCSPGGLVREIYTTIVDKNEELMSKPPVFFATISEGVLVHLPNIKVLSSVYKIISKITKSFLSEDSKGLLYSLIRKMYLNQIHVLENAVNKYNEQQDIENSMVTNDFSNLVDLLSAKGFIPFKMSDRKAIMNLHVSLRKLLPVLASNEPCEDIFNNILISLPTGCEVDVSKKLMMFKPIADMMSAFTTLDFQSFLDHTTVKQNINLLMGLSLSLYPEYKDYNPLNWSEYLEMASYSVQYDSVSLLRYLLKTLTNAMKILRYYIKKMEDDMKKMTKKQVDRYRIICYCIVNQLTGVILPGCGYILHIIKSLSLMLLQFISRKFVVNENQKRKLDLIELVFKASYLLYHSKKKRDKILTLMANDMNKNRNNSEVKTIEQISSFIFENKDNEFPLVDDTAKETNESNYDILYDDIVKLLSETNKTPLDLFKECKGLTLEIYRNIQLKSRSMIKNNILKSISSCYSYLIEYSKLIQNVKGNQFNFHVYRQVEIDTKFILPLLSDSLFNEGVLLCLPDSLIEKGNIAVVELLKAYSVDNYNAFPKGLFPIPNIFKLYNASDTILQYKIIIEKRKTEVKNWKDNNSGDKSFQEKDQKSNISINISSRSAFIPLVDILENLYIDEIAHQSSSTTSNLKNFVVEYDPLVRNTNTTYLDIIRQADLVQIMKEMLKKGKIEGKGKDIIVYCTNKLIKKCQKHGYFRKAYPSFCDMCISVSQKYRSIDPLTFFLFSRKKDVKEIELLFERDINKFQEKLEQIPTHVISIFCYTPSNMDSCKVNEYMKYMKKEFNKRDLSIPDNVIERSLSAIEGISTLLAIDILPKDERTLKITRNGKVSKYYHFVEEVLETLSSKCYGFNGPKESENTLCINLINKYFINQLMNSTGYSLKGIHSFEEFPEGLMVILQKLRYINYSLQQNNYANNISRKEDDKKESGSNQIISYRKFISNFGLLRENCSNDGQMTPILDEQENNIEVFAELFKRIKVLSEQKWSEKQDEENEMQKKYNGIMGKYRPDSAVYSLFVRGLLPVVSPLDVTKGSKKDIIPLDVLFSRIEFYLVSSEESNDFGESPEIDLDLLCRLSISILKGLEQVSRILHYAKNKPRHQKKYIPKKKAPEFDMFGEDISASGRTSKFNNLVSKAVEDEKVEEELLSSINSMMRKTKEYKVVLNIILSLLLDVLNNSNKCNFQYSKDRGYHDSILKSLKQSEDLGVVKYTSVIPPIIENIYSLVLSSISWGYIKTARFEGEDNRINKIVREICEDIKKSKNRENHNMVLKDAMDVIKDSVHLLEKKQTVLDFFEKCSMELKKILCSKEEKKKNCALMFKIFLSNLQCQTIGIKSLRKHIQLYRQISSALWNPKSILLLKADHSQSFYLSKKLIKVITKEKIIELVNSASYLDQGVGYTMPWGLADCRFVIIHIEWLKAAEKGRK